MTKRSTHRAADREGHSSAGRCPRNVVWKVALELRCWRIHCVGIFDSSPLSDLRCSRKFYGTRTKVVPRSFALPVLWQEGRFLVQQGNYSQRTRKHKKNDVSCLHGRSIFLMRKGTRIESPPHIWAKLVAKLRESTRYRAVLRICVVGFWTVIDERGVLPSEKCMNGNRWVENYEM